MQKNLDLVRFDDKLIYHGSYSLTPRAVKVLCYIIARHIDPKQDTQLPTSIEVPLTDIINHAIQGTSKSIYQEIENICEELTSKIHFSSGVEIDGYELRGFITWCSSAIPVKKDGTIYVRFGFDPLMAQFLLGLKQYVRLYRPEINRLKGSHAIRIFQMLKGIRNKKSKYEVVSREIYEVEKLKFLLGIANNYKKFKDFRKWVIDKSVKEINRETTVKIIDVIYIKEGRKIKSLQFVFTDQQPVKAVPTLPLWEGEFTPTVGEIDALPWAKFNAYNRLVEFGVEGGIAYKQIIPTIKGTEIRGYEDHFIEKALEIFKQKARQQDAGTFVKWWIGKKVFDSTGDLWAVILEDIIRYKKDIQKTHPKAYSNRIVAMNIPKAEFIEQYRKEETEDETMEKVDLKKQTKKDFVAIGDFLSEKIKV